MRTQGLGFACRVKGQLQEAASNGGAYIKARKADGEPYRGYIVELALNPKP